MKILLGKNRLNGTAIENEGQFAEGTPAIRKEEDDIVLIQNKSEKPEIMFEDVSLRDSHIKHYRMTDGTMNAVIFNEPVHYYDEDSHCFRNIDNRLKKMEGNNTDFFNGYETRNNDFKVSLAGDLDQKYLMRVSKGVHSILWKVSEKGNTTNQGEIGYARNNAVKTIVSDDDENEQNELQVNPDGTILYSGMFENADLQYIISGDIVKENIIVKEKLGVYSYAFEIETHNLEVGLSQDNKAIEFYVNYINDDATQNKQVIFSTPSPVMYDAKGEECEDVYYEL